MSQDREHHNQAMRAQAVTVAASLLSSNTPAVHSLLAETTDFGDYVQGTCLLELLSNHILTYITSGEFQR